jgi:hypothetical protein
MNFSKAMARRHNAAGHCIVTVQTAPLLIGKGDIGFYGVLGELGLPHPWRMIEIDHLFRRVDAHPLQHVNQIGVDINAV